MRQQDPSFTWPHGEGSSHPAALAITTDDAVADDAEQQQHVPRDFEACPREDDAASVAHPVFPVIG